MNITKKVWPAISENYLCLVGHPKEIDAFSKKVANKLKLPLFKTTLKKNSSKQIDENFWHCYELGGVYQVNNIENITMDIYTILYWSIVIPSLWNISTLREIKKHENFKLIVGINKPSKYLGRYLIDFAFLDKFLIVELNK